MYQCPASSPLGWWVHFGSQRPTMKSIRIATILVVATASVIAQTQTYAARLISTGGFANTIANGGIGGSLANLATLWNVKGRATNMHPAGFNYSAILGRCGDLSVGYAGTTGLTQEPIVWQAKVPSQLFVPFAYVGGRAVATDGSQIVGYATETDTERGVGATHALVWDVTSGLATDLGDKSTIYGVGGGVQVGTRVGSQGATAGLWNGTAASFVDLHVQSNDVSVACDTNGKIQVGYVGLDVRVRHEGRPRDIRFYSAGYWTGTAESFTYLPSAYRHSFALAIKGETIVGYGNTTDAIGTPQFSHAVAWLGEDHEYVDLHALLPADMRTSRASGIDEFGNIVGYGITTAGVFRSYVWLRQ